MQYSKRLIEALSLIFKVSAVRRWEDALAVYTKILTRFVSTKELKLRVSFEVPAEGDQGAAKANETRTGLKELGLDDNVDVR
jgi:hypothetical protein